MKRICIAVLMSVGALANVQASGFNLDEVPDFPEITLAAPTVSDSGPTSCSQEANKIWENFQAPELTRELKPFDEVYAAKKVTTGGEDEQPTQDASKSLHPALPDFLKEAS